MRIFLSHSGRDKALVRELASHLPRWLKTWVDEDRLLMGAGLGASLREAIDIEVDFVVLLFSTDAADSRWVSDEIRWALDKETELDRTFLLPVVLGDAGERFEGLDLSNRLYLELRDFGSASVRTLAEQVADHIASWMSELLARTPAAQSHPVVGDSIEKLAGSIAAHIAEIPLPLRGDVESLLVRPFVDDLAACRSGNVPLTATQYYQRILAEMSRASQADVVLAISTLSSDLWTEDQDQTRYAALNDEALARGASIQRLFVVPTASAGAYEAEVRRQEEAGVSARVSGAGLLASIPDIQDFVLFQRGDEVRAYVAQPSIDGSRRVRCGELVLAEHTLDRLRRSFRTAWDVSSPPDVFFVAGVGHTGPVTSQPPGKRLRAHKLRRPVVTCEEAAEARGIPLEQELKTLLLRTASGIVAAHMPADGRLSLRKVKARLESAEAYLADPEDLLDLGLSPGTVSAVLDPVWSLPHLISRRLLTMDKVMTNNGTRTGYYQFSPAILTEAANVIVDDFEK